MRRLVAALFAVLAIAVVAAGCGGGGDSTAGTDTTGSTDTEAESGAAAPAKAAFIKEADKVCSDAELELSEEVIAYAKDQGIDIEAEEEPSDAQKTEIYEQIVIPNIARQAEELAALTPPKGDEEAFEDLTSTLADEAQAAEEDPGNLDEGAFEEASKKAHEFGLTSCGA
ncbi:MAG: hypothetical protein JST08_07925 [Actinobacteria bacterium]|nr:hypothetical protein [Actinomycetota bacterium]